MDYTAVSLITGCRRLYKYIDFIYIVNKNNTLE